MPGGAQANPKYADSTQTRAGDGSQDSPDIERGELLKEAEENQDIAEE